jgi:hypothetical protein
MSRTTISAAFTKRCKPRQRIALGITDHMWTIGELIDAAFAAAPAKATPTAPDRFKDFWKD